MIKKEKHPVFDEIKKNKKELSYDEFFTTEIWYKRTYLKPEWFTDKEWRSLKRLTRIHKKH